MAPRTDRISPEAARTKIEQGDALLVCAYEEDEKCSEHRLTGSVTLTDLDKQQLGGRQLIFYCA